MKWFNTLSHNRWLEQETDRIFSFGKHAAVPTGFGWLGNNGQVKPDNGTHLWITARMLHVYAVAASMGRPGAYQLVEHGINALNGALRDKKYGGWYACVNDEGVLDASKQGYQHFLYCWAPPAPLPPVIRRHVHCWMRRSRSLNVTSGVKTSRCARNPGTRHSARPKTTGEGTPICTPLKRS